MIKLRKVMLKLAYPPKNYAILVINRKNPPIEGDSITVNGLTAVFKKR